MSEFFRYLTLSFLLEGAWLTIKIAAASMTGGLLLGLVVALMRLSPYRLLSLGAWLYIWLLRGTPVLLQLVFLFDALPAVGIVMDPVTTAIIGFALNEAAFAGEVIRGGILAVSRNQTLAAASLGMGPLLTLRRIVLPQAMRAILPAIGNDTISVLKGTSLASVIAVNELTLRSQQIVAQNFRFFAVFTASVQSRARAPTPGRVRARSVLRLSARSSAPASRGADRHRGRGARARRGVPFRRAGRGGGRGRHCEGRRRRGDSEVR